MIEETVSRSRLSDFVREYRGDPAGVTGALLLLLLLVGAALGPFLVPFPESGRRWHDITYWADSPQSAPPAWTNWFRRSKAAVSQVLAPVGGETQQSGGVTLVRRDFVYDERWDQPPQDLIVRFGGSGALAAALSLERPDGETVQLFSAQVTAGDGEPVRISLDNDCREAALTLIAAHGGGAAAAGSDTGQARAAEVLLARAEPGMGDRPRPLKGRYVLRLSTLLLAADSTVGDASLAVAGRVSGILGTDAAKRDLWSGLVAGTRWALLIGLLTALVSVSIGVLAGVASAWHRGWIEWAIQRVFEIVVNMPLLPLLIILSAVFRLNIWYFMGIMCLSFWTGPVKTVYSMALQIKEEAFIEASSALGAGSASIIFRHMVPLLLPYAFASMALYVPGAVVYEATVSLLGLGDAGIVSWGQILHDAFAGAAVLNRLWWWVVPPGLMIAVVGMTFAFVGFAMDKVLHPRLRTR